MQLTAELELVGNVGGAQAASLPTDLESVGDVGGAQSKFRSASKPEKFYKTGSLKESYKAAFFRAKLDAFRMRRRADLILFNGPPQTTAYNLSEINVHNDQTRSTLEVCRGRGLQLLEMDNLTHGKVFTDLTRSTDIKLFPAYYSREYKANRGTSKPAFEAFQLHAEAKWGYKIQDGTDDRKKFGIFNRNKYLNTFFDNLAAAAAEEALAAVNESPEAHVAQEAQTIKRHLIEDFRTAVLQAKDFIESTDFVPLGMSLMPVVEATGNSERPYQLSLTAIDPDHLMATEGDPTLQNAADEARNVEEGDPTLQNEEEASIFCGTKQRVDALKEEMAGNLEALYENTGKLLEGL